MERFKFTKTSLKALVKAGIAGKWSDEEIKGMYFEITSHGGQFFRLAKKFNGKKVTVKLGDFQTMTVEQARNEAKDNLELMRNKINPNEEKKAERVARKNTRYYSDIFENYKVTFKQKIKDKERRQISLTQTESIFKNHTNPVFFKKDVRSLTDTQAEEIIKALKENKSPPVFNKCLTQIKAVFKHAKINVGAFTNEEKPSDNERDRVLTMSEEARLLKALDLEEPIYKDIVMIALLTGQRKQSILSMEWQEVDLYQKIWAIPKDKTKSNKPIDVPLITEALEILTRRSKEAQTNERYVFARVSSNRSKLGHATVNSGEGSLWWRVLKRADLYADDKHARLTFHDLRRTTATRMARGGVNIAVIQKTLAHSSIDVTAKIYAHHSTNQVREALEQTWNKPVLPMDALKEQLKALTPEERQELLGGDL
jgi:integrase